MKSNRQLIKQSDSTAVFDILPISKYNRRKERSNAAPKYIILVSVFSILESYSTIVLYCTTVSVQY